MTATATLAADAPRPISVVAADALFAASLRCGEVPDATRAPEMILGEITAYGAAGCAACVAGEFGHHPDTAVARMVKVRRVVAELGLN